MSVKRPRTHGFSLVELLVVITILVLLLALLSPALDKAMHRMELTACAARQHGLLTIFNGYAAAERRKYPLGKETATTYESIIFTTWDFVRIVEAYTGNNKSPTLDNGSVQVGVVPQMLVDAAFKDFGYRNTTRYVLGYGYLGGHPALSGPNPGFQSPMGLADQGSGELVACINIWSVGAVPPVAGIMVSPFTISAHTVNGPTGSYRAGNPHSYFDQDGPYSGADPAQYHQALGGNVARTDGSVGWKQIGDMRLRFSGAGPGASPDSENYNPGYW
jgi:prepilin-type N-terminal cleavage/methylation domain-containing protein